MTQDGPHGTPSLVRLWDTRKRGQSLRMEAEKARPHGCRRPVILKSSEGDYVAIPCFGWTCPDCTKKLVAELLGRVDYGAEVERNTGGRVPMELTVTLPGHIDTKRHGLHSSQVYACEQRAHRSLMTRLRLRAKRRGLGQVIYFRSREVQPKRGSLAPHLLVYGDLFQGMNKREREALLQDCGFGFKHTWEPVKHLDGLVGYYAKYITEHSALRIPKSARRYTYSPEFMPSRADWMLMRALFAETSEFYLRADGEGTHYRDGGIALGVSGGLLVVDHSNRWWMTPEWRAYRERELERAEFNRRYWRAVVHDREVDQGELPSWVFLGQFMAA